jgi:hypothetical protein
MKTFLLLSLLALFAIPALRAQTSTLVTVEDNGTRSTRLNLVFLSEGYTSAQMGTFANDVDAAVDFLFTREPWVRYRSYCNIYRIEVASNQSGTDNGTGGGSRDTYFQTGFNTPGIPQLNTLAGNGSSRAYGLLNTHVPEYDIPIILINDPKYGGSGGPIALTTTDPSSAGILEHELGHSFAKLTDEYDEEYPGYPNTEYPNATAKTVLDQIRWKVWIESGTPVPRTPEYDPLYTDKVGHFEGANYHRSGWFRPHDAALMRFLNTPPGSVTREAILLTIYGRVSPAADHQMHTTPRLSYLQPSESLKQTVTAQVQLNFSLPLSPSTGPGHSYQWFVDGQVQAGTSSTFDIESAVLGNGVHTVKAIVSDQTDWVRRDPTGLITDEVIWTLTLSNQTGPTFLADPLTDVRVVREFSDLRLDAESSGAGPVTYQWLKVGKVFTPTDVSSHVIDPVTMADAGLYTVKITSGGITNTHNVTLSVFTPTMPRVVVGKGKTATLTFTSSAGLPPVAWSFNGNPISNNSHYAGATTKSLQVKLVDLADSGRYYFTAGDSDPGYIDLLVVTTKPDYAGVSLTLDTGIVGGLYDEQFPLPSMSFQMPNSFTGTMPKGLKLDPKTGRITGIPTVASKNQILGDEITFTVGNEFGKVTLKTRLLIKALPAGFAGVFSGPVLSDNNLGRDTGGRIDLTIQSTGSYSGKTIVGADTLSFSGTLMLSGPGATTATGQFSVTPKGELPAQIFFILDDSDDGDPLTATITATASGIPAFTAWRNKWLAPEAVDTFQGYHTFAFEAPVEEGAPKGHGFGSVTIDATGKTTVAGRLADGETFGTVSHVGPNGTVLIYQTLYTTTEKGSVLGTLDINPGAPAIFSTASSVRWLRPASTARTYKDGFGPLEIDAFGSAYNPPDTGEIIMGLSAADGDPLKNALLEFAPILGADPVAVDSDVTLEVKAGGATKVNAPNPELVTFTVTPKDGRFKGTYTTKDNDPRSTAPVPPVITRKVEFQGIILTDDGTQFGYGFFLREALPKADGSTTPTTSPKDSGWLLLRNSNL